MRRFVGAMDEVGTAVYLDYNSTSPLAPEVLETVSAALRDAWANPSSRHAAGLLASLQNGREKSNNYAGSILTTGVIGLLLGECY